MSDYLSYLKKDTVKCEMHGWIACNSGCLLKNFCNKKRMANVLINLSDIILGWKRRKGKVWEKSWENESAC